MGKAKYLKVGDRVRIVEGKRFMRCGYPLNFEVLKKTRTKEVETKVFAAAKAAGLNAHSERVFNHLTNAVCSDILQKEKFGGSVRSIFEEDYPALKGVEGEITSRKMVKTGRYSPGYHCWEGEWEPPTLDGQETWCIYTIRPDRFIPSNTRKSDDDWDLDYSHCYMSLQVRAIYCEPVVDLEHVKMLGQKGGKSLSVARAMEALTDVQS
jgi:hypothetical protein